jgi:hypothetical protein
MTTVSPAHSFDYSGPHFSPTRNPHDFISDFRYLWTQRLPDLPNRPLKDIKIPSRTKGHENTVQGHEVHMVRSSMRLQFLEVK